MEKEIIVNVNMEKVKFTTETIKLTYPTEPKYYMMVDEGRFFPRGKVLFAIIPKYETSFILVEVEEDKQYVTDFVPTKDCKQEYWLSDKNNIRRTALGIMRGKEYEYHEISEKEFFEIRDQHLNKWMKVLDKQK